MLAIDFPQRNIILAENQPEYEPLPAFCELREVVLPDDAGQFVTKEVPWNMTACFQLNKEEIDEIIRTGRLWYTQHLFGGQFQPITMTTQNPFEPVNEKE